MKAIFYWLLTEINSKERYLIAMDWNKFLTFPFSMFKSNKILFFIYLLCLILFVNLDIAVPNFLIGSIIKLFLTIFFLLFPLSFCVKNEMLEKYSFKTTIPIEYFASGFFIIFCIYLYLFNSKFRIFVSSDFKAEFNLLHTLSFILISALIYFCYGLFSYFKKIKTINFIFLILSAQVFYFDRFIYNFFDKNFDYGVSAFIAFYLGICASFLYDNIIKHKEPAGLFWEAFRVDISFWCLEVLADKPNIKQSEEYKISNRAKIIYHYVECVLWFIVNASIWVSVIITIIGLVMSKF